MSIIKMRPPRIAAALILAAAIVHWFASNGNSMRFASPRVGAFLGLAGFTLMMWAWLLFKRQNLAVCLPDRTAHITKTGPYRFTRNPMYLGMILMMLGLALFIGTAPFYLSAIVYFGILNFAFCPFEEDKLTAAFGEEYSQYRNRVRRWF